MADAPRAASGDGPSLPRPCGAKPGGPGPWVIGSAICPESKAGAPDTTWWPPRTCFSRDAVQGGDAQAGAFHRHANSPRNRPEGSGGEAKPECDADAALAAAMQLEEMEQAQRAPAAMAMAPDPPRDEVWGVLPATLSGRGAPSVCWAFLFGCCPCCFVGCYTDTGQNAWRRFLTMWSTAIGVLQVLVFFFGVAAHGGFAPMTENAMIGPHWYALDAMGAKNTARIVEEREWWRLVTPIFLHGGLLHLVGNLLMQFRTAASLEVVWGHSAWLAIFTYSGICANLASAVVLPRALAVGSSGALCGLIGAWLTFILITWNQTLPRDVPTRNSMATSVLMSIVLVVGLSFVPMLDFAAHLGGLCSGASLAAALFASRLQDPRWRRGTLAGGVLCAGLLPLTLLLQLLFNTEIDPNLLRICEHDPSGC